MEDFDELDGLADLDLLIDLDGEDFREEVEGSEGASPEVEDEEFDFYKLSKARQAQIMRIARVLEAKEQTLDLAHPAEATVRPALLKEDEQRAVEPVLPSRTSYTMAADVALRAMDAREQILDSVADFGPEARAAALSVLAGTPAEALLHPASIDLISNYAIGEAVKRGRMAVVTGPGSAEPSVSGQAGARGMRSFQVVFGGSSLSAAEREELKAVGL